MGNGEKRNDGHSLSITILFEEYRALYGLALMRLDALEQRVPLAAGSLAGFVAAVVAFPPQAQTFILVAVPFALVWVLNTTINHARSFEDALRRIEQIERQVNETVGARLLRFQSDHPSRGHSTGGRTGTETVQAVLMASGLILVGLAWLAQSQAGMPALVQAGYFTALAGVAGTMLLAIRRFRRYRYEPVGDEPTVEIGAANDRADEELTLRS